MDELDSRSPGKRVGLVAFNSEVIIIGDGNMESVRISGDQLSDENMLENSLRNIPAFECIGKLSGKLREKLLT